MKDPSYFFPDGAPDSPQNYDPEGASLSVLNASTYLKSIGDRANEKTLSDKLKVTTKHVGNGPGEVTIETDSDTASELTKLLKIGGTTLDNYSRMQAEKQAQIDQLKSHPWVNALATIAGSLAANDRNPITRGLGQAAQKLNPTLQELQGQQMQILQGQGQAAQQYAGLLGHQLSAEQHRIAAEQQKIGNQFREREIKVQEGGLALKEKELPGKLEKTAFDESQKVMKPYEDAAKKGTPPSHDSYVQQMVVRGKMTPEAAEASYKALIDQAQGAVVTKSADEQRKVATRITEANRKSQTMEDRQKRIIDYRTGKVVDAAAAKELGTLGAKDMQRVKGLGVRNSFLDRLESRIGSGGDLRDYIGLGRNLLDLLPTSLQPTERIVVKQLVIDELRQNIANADAGVRGWSKAEAPLLKQLGAAIENNPDQVDAIIAQLRLASGEELQGLKGAHPNAKWDVLRPLTDPVDAASVKSGGKSSTKPRDPLGIR